MQRRDETARGVIFVIDHFSTHDGPGIRAAVYFMGCPVLDELLPDKVFFDSSGSGVTLSGRGGHPHCFRDQRHGPVGGFSRTIGLYKPIFYGIKAIAPEKHRRFHWRWQRNGFLIIFLALSACVMASGLHCVPR